MQDLSISSRGAKYLAKSKQRTENTDSEVTTSFSKNGKTLSHNKGQRLKFHGHILGMDEEDLQNKHLIPTEKNGNQWLKRIEQDMQEIGIADEVTQD